MAALLKTFLQGMVMGLGATLPGVSGSTLAMLMGIYSQVISSLYAFTLLPNWVISLGKEKFPLKLNIVIPLGMGILSSILILATTVEGLLVSATTPVMSTLCGLILGILWQQRHNIDLRDRAQILLVLSGIFFSGLLGLLLPLPKSELSGLMAFFAGLVLICAVLVPGVSSAFTLLMLKTYAFIALALRGLIAGNLSGQSLSGIILLALGVVIGFVVLIRGLNWLMIHKKSYLNALVSGLIIGSLRSLWPFATFQGEEITYLPLDNVSSSDMILAASFLLIAFLLFTLFTNATERQHKR